MRQSSSRVNFLNRVKILSAKKIVIRSRFGHFFSLSSYEKNLSRIFGIKEGTIFSVEHQTTLGVRLYLERFKKLGFINEYGEGSQKSDYPKFYHASTSFFSVEEDEKSKQMSWGFSFLNESPEMSLYKALIEAVERHATYYSHNSKTIFYPTFYYGDASYLFDLVPHFRKEQTNAYPYLAGTKEQCKNMLGFKVRSVCTGKKSFFPVHAFYFGINTFSREQPILFDPTSNGSGAGSTKEMATLSAVYEMIERDHFHLYWFAGITPKQIFLDEETDIGVYIKKISKRYNLEIYVYDMRYDFDIKACFVVIVDPVLHIVSCGARVGQDPLKVVEGALLEALAVLNSVREVGKMMNEEEMKKVLQSKTYLNEGIDKQGRVRLYSSEEGIKILRKEFFAKSQGSISFGDFSEGSRIFSSQKEELAFIIKDFKKLKGVHGDGYDLFIHEASSIYSEIMNLYVMHAFSPALLKLHLNEIFSTPISERLIRFAQKKGKINFCQDDINPLPHFFP